MALLQEAYTTSGLPYSIILPMNASFVHSVAYLGGQQHLVNAANVQLLAIQSFCNIWIS